MLPFFSFPYITENYQVTLLRMARHVIRVQSRLQEWVRRTVRAWEQSQASPKPSPPRAEVSLRGGPVVHPGKSMKGARIGAPPAAVAEDSLASSTSSWSRPLVTDFDDEMEGPIVVVPAAANNRPAEAGRGMTTASLAATAQRLPISSTLGESAKNGPQGKQQGNTVNQTGEDKIASPTSPKSVKDQSSPRPLGSFAGDGIQASAQPTAGVPSPTSPSASPSLLTKVHEKDAGEHHESRPVAAHPTSRNKLYRKGHVTRRPLRGSERNSLIGDEDISVDSMAPAAVFDTAKDLPSASAAAPAANGAIAAAAASSLATPAVTVSGDSVATDLQATEARTADDGGRMTLQITSQDSGDTDSSSYFTAVVGSSSTMSTAHATRRPSALSQDAAPEFCGGAAEAPETPIPRPLQIHSKDEDASSTRSSSPEIYI